IYLEIDIPRSGKSCSLCRFAGKRTYTISDWGCFGLEHPRGQWAISDCHILSSFSVMSIGDVFQEVNRHEVLGYIDTIMSDSEDSMVTYTTVSSPCERRSGDVSPGEDGLPVMPEDPYEPEQEPPSPVYIPYVSEPVYPEYIAPEDDVFPAEEQPLPVAATPTTDSPGYIPESDLDEDLEDDDDDEDPEEDPADYPTDHDDDDEEEEPSRDDADEEDGEPQPPTLSFTKEDAESITPILPIPLHVASPPLQLLSSDRRANRPEVTLSPRKRLSIVHCPRYETGESSVAVSARTIKGHRADYRFVNSVEAEIIRRRVEDIIYGIRDTWIDPRDVAEEVALTTLEGVNTRVTELAAVQEQDTPRTSIERLDFLESLGCILWDLRHLTTALGEIRALQAREQAHAGAPEGADSST
nr:hypothetical protein [Tanacetum cinerariifolium]